MKRRILLLLLVIFLVLPSVLVYADDVTDDDMIYLLTSDTEEIVNTLRTNINIAASKMSELSSTTEKQLANLLYITKMYKSFMYLSKIEKFWPDLASDDPTIVDEAKAAKNLLLSNVAIDIRRAVEGYMNEFGFDASSPYGQLLFTDVVVGGDQGNIDMITQQINNAVTVLIPDIVQDHVKYEIIGLDPGQDIPISDADIDYEVLSNRYSEQLEFCNVILSNLSNPEDDLEFARTNNPAAAFKHWFIDLLMWNDTIIGARTFSQNAIVKKLLEKARERVYVEPMDNPNISLYLEAGWDLEALAYVKRDTSTDLDDRNFSLNSWIPTDDDQLLRPIYLAMLASTAVYTPFRSHVGDEDYMAALTSLLDSQTAEQAIELFDKIKDYRKPLYMINSTTFVDSISNLWGSTFSPAIAGSKLAYASVKSNYKGNSYRATLGDLIDVADNEKNTIFFTVRGTFDVKADTNTWAFYQAPGSAEAKLASKPSSVGSDGTYLNAEGDVSSDKYTLALFEIGSKPGTFSTSLLLFKNIYQGLKNLSQLDVQENSFLYMNAFGDIVLADNTVIIPGSANPLMYNPTVNGTSTGYNPYTVAFMNNYPYVAQDSTILTITNRADEGKYMLFTDNNILETFMNKFKVDFNSTSKSMTADEVKTYKTFDHSHLQLRKISSEETYKKDIIRQAVDLFPYFYAGTSEGVPKFYSFARFAYTDETTVAKSDPLKSAGELLGKIIDDVVYTIKARAIVFEQAITTSQTALFPYDMDSNVKVNMDGTVDDSEYAVAKLIAQNMLWYYRYGPNLLAEANANGILRQDYIYENILVEILQGSTMVSTYEKNVDLDQVLLASTKDESLEGLKKAANSLLKNVGDMDGVLGMGSAENDKLFGRIVMFAKEYAVVFVFIFFVMFILRYMKRGDFLYIVTMSAMSGALVFLFIFILPTYLPVAYNSVSSMFTESLTAETLLYKAEQYSTTYGSAGVLDDNDDYSIQTASLTLYRLNEQQIDNFCAQYVIPEESFRYGDRVILDPDIGLYIQGSSLKINTDVLFANNPIYGAYESMSLRTAAATTSNVGDRVYYQLHNDKLASSSLDYYCPFFVIEDGLVETLNSLLRVYNIPRSTSNYVGGLVKDSYIMFNYTNSIPFLYGWDMSQPLGLTPLELMKLEEAFPIPMDFLNLKDVIESPTNAMQETLWFKTMVINGFYDPEYGAERRQFLLEYVNYHTKRFIINNQAKIGLVSDENMIKMVALQATFFFNQKIGEFGTWVYPTNFNQEEMKLSDVFLTALTSNDDKFIRHSMDIVEYISDIYGIWGVGVFIVLLAICMIIILIVKISMPVFYIILGILLFLRFVTDKEFGDLLKGYLKVTGLIALLYTIFIITLCHLPRVLSGWSMMICLALASFLLLIGLITVLIGFFWDLGNMGNEGIGAALVKNPITNILYAPVRGVTEFLTENVHAPWVMTGDDLPTLVSDYDETSSILAALNRDYSSDFTGQTTSPKFLFGKVVSNGSHGDRDTDSHTIVSNDNSDYATGNDYFSFDSMEEGK